MASMADAMNTLLDAAGFRPARRGEEPVLFSKRIETPLGAMLALGRNDGLCLLEFLDRVDLAKQLAALRRFFPLPYSTDGCSLLERVRKEVDEYFNHGRRAFGIPLFSPGTAFQERVWAGLRAIPWGQTRSYKELASSIGAPAACRAVGAANARNRIAILIPCHRVVHASGRGSGGYAGGEWRKERLLEVEATR